MNDLTLPLPAAHPRSIEQSSGAYLRIDPLGALVGIWAGSAEMTMRMDANQVEALAEALGRLEDEPVIHLSGPVMPFLLPVGAIGGGDIAEDPVEAVKSWFAGIQACKNKIDRLEADISSAERELMGIEKERSRWVPMVRETLADGLPKRTNMQNAGAVAHYDEQIADVRAEIAAFRADLAQTRQSLAQLEASPPRTALQAVALLKTRLETCNLDAQQAATRLEDCQADIKQIERATQALDAEKAQAAKTCWESAAANNIDDDEKVIEEISKAHARLDRESASATGRLYRLKIMADRLRDLADQANATLKAEQEESLPLRAWLVSMLRRIEARRIMDHVQDALGLEVAKLAALCALSGDGFRSMDVGDLLRLDQLQITPDAAAQATAVAALEGRL